MEPRPFLGGCSCVTDYEKLCRIGEGTYGTVHKARHKAGGDVVALKHVKALAASDGVPRTTLREIKLLRALEHPNVVRLISVVVGVRPESVFLVFEYCDHDMALLADELGVQWKEGEVKTIVLQLLRGLEYIHARHVVHRDVKLSNVLYTNRGEVKLCDFGMARLCGVAPRSMTRQVTTLWYRAPELLLGEARYGVAVDVWAAGCVAGELLLSEPLLPGETESDQFERIAGLLGPPTDSAWPGFNRLPLAGELRLQGLSSAGLLPRRRVPGLGTAAHEFLAHLLRYDPAARPSASALLLHGYFSCAPLTVAAAAMPSYPSVHGQHRPLPGRKLALRKTPERQRPARAPRPTEVLLQSLAAGKRAASGGIRPLNFSKVRRT
eukprot:TRINITY_DN25720_c0_g1_i2.p1 TRINITY_DN25720_c0_g1~~TRINITY_DN25720_c0_g1_i2.p1  ORF type:complete len:398 (+),score=120.91 TRINITY_DN25720_c0_g1_i2:55-1194(+)